MPTGYTAAVADGSISDLRPFAMLCARGMGALVTMRDMPFDAEIPDQFEPNNYHAKKISELTAERHRLHAMTMAEADEAAAAEYRADVEAKEGYLKGRSEQRDRYNAMIKLVEGWESSPEGLKQFMLDQLYSSRKFDCPEGDTYWRAIEQRDGEEWRHLKLEKVNKDIEYHTVEDAKERARTDSRNAWLRQLRASLDAVEKSNADAIRTAERSQRQSWMMFEPENERGCGDYWPVRPTNERTARG